MVTCQDSGDGPTPPAGKVIAFPGADGGGRYTTGGQGGNIYVVTSLEDDIVDPKIGTLRYGIQTTGKRIIVFNVAGRIDLKGDLSIRSGSVTILGQSAPGDGICLSGYPLIVRANNVIIRFLRFRMGDLNGREADALTIEKGHSNIIVDHCSCSWSTDECLSIYGVENATVQYCIVSESLNNSVHAKGAHGYAGIWGGKNTSFHHNLLAHHSSRMPRFDHDYVTEANVGPTDFINNVVYNWGGNSAYGGESRKTSGNQRQYNFIANYYKPGPATKSEVKARLLNPTTKCGNCGSSVVPGKFYVVNNTMYGSSTVTADNWSGVYPDESSKKEQCKSTLRFSFDYCMTKEQTAQEAYDAVLAKVGCSLKRDAVDARIVDEVQKGTYTYSGSNGSTGGLIDTPADVGGWPEYTGTKDFSLDTDKDGIPNEWETLHGLDPEDPKDARATTLSKPYLNLEVYLNDIVVHLY
ncbi:MAG: pectate lyase [Paludibacteraceae bacterium]|nr:pectate lyase [Paludibacteraceae bacterium]